MDDGATMAARLRPEWLGAYRAYMESLDAEFEQYESSIHQDGFAAGWTLGIEAADHNAAAALAESRAAVERLRAEMEDAIRTVFALMRLFPKDDPIAVELWRTCVAMRAARRRGDD